MVKNLPAMQETWVLSLGWEDPLEKGIATHSSILAWNISWREEPGGLQFIRLQRVRQDRTTNTFNFSINYKDFLGRSVVKNLPANAGDADLIPGSGGCPGGGDGNLLQSCCLGNPMDRGVWWTASV